MNNTDYIIALGILDAFTEVKIPHNNILKPNTFLGHKVYMSRIIQICNN